MLWKRIVKVASLEIAVVLFWLVRLIISDVNSASVEAGENGTSRASGSWPGAATTLMM